MDWNQTKPPLGSQINWAHPLSKGIVGCWLFNEGMGDKVYDLSGNGNTGTLSGFSHPATGLNGWNPGYVTQGDQLGFNKTDASYISFGEAKILNSFTALTIVAKIRPYSLSLSNRGTIITRLVSSLVADPYQVFGIAINIIKEGDVFFSLSKGVAGSRVYVVSNNIIKLGNNDITCTWDGSIMNVNINGVKDSATGSFTGQNGSSIQPIIMGFNNFTVDTGWHDHYHGAIEYIIIYNRCITPQEIEQHRISPLCFIN